MLAITTSSATIRLSLAGLGCDGWPACYEASRASGGVGIDVELARGVHRIAASLAGVWVLTMLVLLWGEQRGAAQRAALIGLVALAAGLAVLGLVTPSPLPAVVLGNLLGGLAMVWLAAFLLGGPAGTPARAPAPARDRLGTATRTALRVAIVMVFVQSALGGLLGAHGAATQCATLPGCAVGVPWPSLAWTVLWPFASVPTDRGDAGYAAGLAMLHVVHRIAAIAVLGAVLAWARLAWRAPVPERQPVVVLVALALVVALPGIGAGVVALGYPLRGALAHNAATALLVATLGWASGRAAAVGFADRERRIA